MASLRETSTVRQRPRTLQRVTPKHLTLSGFDAIGGAQPSFEQGKGPRGLTPKGSSATFSGVVYSMTFVPGPYATYHDTEMVPAIRIG